MPYIQVKRGKPTLYQTGEREFVCKGLGAEYTGTTARGAYTGWKNQVALNELTSTEADKLREMSRQQRAMSHARLMMP